LKKIFKNLSFVKFQTAAAAAQAIEMFKDFKLGGCNLRVRYNVKQSTRDSNPYASVGSNSSNDDVFRKTSLKSTTNGDPSRETKSIAEDGDDWEPVSSSNRRPIVSETSDSSVFQTKVKESTPTRHSSSALSDHGSTHSSTDSKLRSSRFRLFLLNFLVI
jgi:hypothetical protein